MGQHGKRLSNIRSLIRLKICGQGHKNPITFTHTPDELDF